MKVHNLIIVFFVIACFACQHESANVQKKAIESINTGHTIMKVRTAVKDGTQIIVGSTYEGKLLAFTYDGSKLWENPLSGFMNHDLWCADVTGDGNDEILAANADGSVYCVGPKGRLLWRFKKNDAPMYSVTSIHDGDKVYVVCGGYDKKIYYINGEGKELKVVSSYNYSVENPWYPYPKPIPDSTCHIANFIRPVKLSDGKESLAVHGVLHSMAINARGSIYLFKTLEEKPYKIIELEEGRPLGEMRCADVNGDGDQEILMGTSNLTEWTLFQVDIKTGDQKLISLQPLSDKIIRFGYRVLQPEVIEQDGQKEFYVLFGAQTITAPIDFNVEKAEVLTSSYSYNDMWKDGMNSKLILASAQSGGSCIHIIDYSNEKWKNEYAELKPEGKIAEIIENSATLRENLENFKKPEWERNPLPVYFMTESLPPSVTELVDSIKHFCESPVFLNSTGYNRGEKTDRSAIKDERYYGRRDPRRTYDATADEIVEHISAVYERDGQGVAFWGGHGNDPYMYRLTTVKRILDHSNGKSTVLIYPELEDHSDHFTYVMEDYFYPLATYCRQKNAKIYVRTKHSFWFANCYLPMWSRLLSGEFSDVFVPSMEETSDKSMELSIAARMGIWASGAVDSWGTRCARDNTSFDRLRQHANQMLPNHFLRMLVYHISSGAQYINNFAVDQKYMSLLWELIAKGALYVPKSNEIVSFSPVHMAIVKPDEYFMEESSNVKWTTFFDEEFEKNNAYVFSRLNGSWPGAPVTDWDFSAYAAGVKDRRLNFLPAYANGMVLMVPPQSGVFAKKNQPRGSLTDHLNPIYKNITKEYYTDGHYYYSEDGKQKYAADEYYKTIQAEIVNSASQLPITVEGEVAWVVAQTAPNHLRLTLIDGGYINPDNQLAKVIFHGISPVNVVDVLSKEKFTVNDSYAEVEIPCGAFRFIDVEITKPLK